MTRECKKHGAEEHLDALNSPRVSKRLRPTQTYEGWVPRMPSDAIVSRISPSTCASTFWEDFVRVRRPVILDGLPSDPKFRAGRWKSLPYLRARAGHTQVRVERRKTVSNRFGQFDCNSLDRMALGDLISHIEGSGELLYLTTQELEFDAMNRPKILTEPIASLQDDFALRPAIMGHLIPMSVNLWLGNSVGSSSGLHHDYHDNLYVLLNGRKHFKLFPPSCAPFMYTLGRVALVHPNGRVCYEGMLTRADGSDAPLESDSAGGGESCIDSRSSPQQGTYNFSAVNLSAPATLLRFNFPEFVSKVAGQCLEVEIQAGECLYLPAGWFHEVTSWSGELDEFHCALNYWFHPPDNLSGAVDQPYTSPFWQNDWNGRGFE